MRFSTACIALSLAAATFPALSDEYDEDGRPLEYVRVCDVYGTGFFYIPGTETCLKITGYVRYEAVENPSRLGVGTVVRGGSERFVAGADDWLDSFGGGGGFEYGLGEGERRLLGRGGAIYNQFVYGDANITGGNASSSGSATNGVDGVSGIGLTFAQYDPAYFTGVGTGTAGFGVSGKAKIDYLGGEFELGYGQSYDDPDEPAKPVFVWRGGLYYEGLNYDSKGFAEVTSGGLPYNGINQSYDYDSDDYYAGFKATAEWYVRPVDQLTLKVGGYVKVGYHWGEADFSQTTNVGGANQVVQHYRYEDTGFVVGGGLAVNADYAIAPNWTIGAGYEFDIVPEVTAAYAPENPNEQPISFSGEAVRQHKVTIRVAASFN